MKNQIIGIILGIVVMSLVACEDIIDIETQPADPIIVVDAWLTNLADEQTIVLTQSQAYFDNSFSEPIAGATVEVVNSDNVTFSFIESEAGTYTWLPAGDSLGVPGMTYTLTINVDGQVLTSTIAGGRVPQIDSIQQEVETEDSFMGPAGTYTNFIARDLPGRGDTYWIKTFKNQRFLDKPAEINIAFDGGFDAGAANLDGLVFIQPIRDATNRIADDGDEDIPPWESGDNIRIEIHSISNEAFFFMETMRDQITNGDNGLFSIPIANAPGNVVNQTTGSEVLGIFNVASVSSATAIID